jgi:hypothetical protein
LDAIASWERYCTDNCVVVAQNVCQQAEAFLKARAPYQAFRKTLKDACMEIGSGPQAGYRWPDTFREVLESQKLFGDNRLAVHRFLSARLLEGLADGARIISVLEDNILTEVPAQSVSDFVSQVTQETRFSPVSVKAKIDQAP